MATQYNKDLKIVYYESREIEILDKEQRPQFYFENIYQLADLIKTSPELSEKLKNLLEE